MKLSIKKPALTITLGVIVSALILSFAYILNLQAKPRKVVLPRVKNCKLQHQTCSAQFPDGGDIQFAISPKTPLPTEELHLQTRFRNFTPDAVRVKFEGVTMKMGYLEYDLKKEKSNDSDTRFRGKGGLAVCIRGVMDWTVIVDIKKGDTIFEVPFEMETLNEPG